MTSFDQDKDFKKAVVIDNLPDSLLQDAIDWISKNLDPEDVFDKEKLSDWASDNAFYKYGQTP
jgi:hypothetical protein